MISFCISAVPPKMEGIAVIIWAARLRCSLAR
jgi:hypothetical protein